MNPSQTIAESYGQARRIARASSSSFYRSFWLLPEAKRKAMDALYAFARITDDLGDCRAAPEQRAAWLLWWRKLTQQALAVADAEDGPPPRPASEAAILPGQTSAASTPTPPPPADLARSADRLLPALVDAAERFQIPPQHLLEIIDGVLADQRKTRFDTFEQLEHYCYLVATAVGLCCLYIWEFHPPLPMAAAVDCGVAFQLTNILRDVREDAARGRIYLPRQHWHQHGLCEDDLLDPRPDARFRCLIEDEIARARRLYRSGWQVWDQVHPDGRAMFSMMWRTYHRLLDRIAADPAAVAGRRIQLPQRERLGIATSHFVPFLFRRLPVPPRDWTDA